MQKKKGTLPVPMDGNRLFRSSLNLATFCGSLWGISSKEQPFVFQRYIYRVCSIVFRRSDLKRHRDKRLWSLVVHQHPF